MRVVVQRVRSAKAVLEGNTIAQIGPGAVLYVGIGAGDPEDTIDWFLSATSGEEGELLVLSQFTLLGRLKGGKPSFHRAKSTQEASEHFERVCLRMKQMFPGRVQTGVFGKSLGIHLELSGKDCVKLLESSDA